MHIDAQLLEQILDNTNEMVQVSDAQTFSMIYANKSAITRGRHPEGESYEGKHCYEYMMGQKEQCSFCPLRQATDADSYETEVHTDDKVYLLKGKKIKLDGREALIAYTNDITELHQARKSYESQISMLLTSIPDAQGIFHLNLSADKIVTINGSTEEVKKLDNINDIDSFITHLASYVPEEEGRKEYFEFFCRDSLLETYKKGKAEINKEVYTYLLDGNVHPARITARLITNPRSNNLECFIYGMDITKETSEREAREEALRNALAQAEHASRAKTTFLNNMSHDIRTPMNAIIGFTSLAVTHIDSQEAVMDYLKKITTSSTHLLSLINDVLDMSRIESGSIKIEETEVHLPDILHDLRTIIQGNVAAKRQDLYIDTQDVKHEDIITDQLRLNQILLNIVSNAIKFTPAGGTINIRIKEKPSSMQGYTSLEFSVKDNGIGMSEEFQSHVFDSFARERNTTKSGAQGTGLGMAITKNIVDMMGGDISLTSELGKGTEFVVKLDCKISGNITLESPLPGFKNARALVVDDDIDTCMNISKMLRDIEMRADWSTSGREAVVRAFEAYEHKDAFSAYIIDLLMPDMNGIETVRRIRKVVGDDVPVIILTAYDWSEIEEEAREAGVTAFVGKPLFMSELRAALTSSPLLEKPTIREHVDCKGKRALLVEDNQLNREIAAEILKEAGLIVDEVEDGADAVELMASPKGSTYDLILMDIQMPRLNGYKATQKIREMEDEKVANIPIVAMTANAFDEDRQKAFDSGMNGHIAKPINIQILLDTLDDVLSNAESV